MPVEIRPTRIELINVNRRIRLARKGLDLLKMKRTSLVMEFFNISRTVRGMRESIRNDLANGLEAVRLAEAFSGIMNLERIADMSADTDARVATKNVMGVRIPSLSFADSFEKRFVNQGRNEDRTIEQTLDLGWELLSVLPEQEMKRVKKDFIQKYGKWKK